jgi:Outer membrane protein transport protein (OMPP1/FadL/TodX)
MRRRLAAALIAGALSAAPCARANPLDPFGFGSRATAMGGATAADSQDFSANYYNPAGLALARRMEISVGYVNVDQSLSIDGKDSGVDPVRAIVAGIVAPGTVAGIPFAFGFGLHLPDDRLSRVRALPEDQPRWELYDNRNQLLYLAANLAISPWPWLQIGGGASFLSSTTATLDISGQVNIYASDSSQLRSAVDADLTAVRYPQAGVRVALGDAVALALVYRGQFALDLDLKANLRGNISGLTTAIYDLQTDSVNNFLPQQVVLGGSWKVGPAVRADLDFTWVNWSAYVPPVAVVQVALDIPPPLGGWPANITPPTTPAPTVVLPIHMHDTVVPHLGVEVRALDTRKLQAFVRAGYEYDKTPIPPQTGETNYVDRDRHAFSFGLGARGMDLLAELPRDLRLDGHVQLSELPTATTVKSNPADLVGEYTAGGTMWNVGVTLTMGF